MDDAKVTAEELKKALAGDFDQMVENCCGDELGSAGADHRRQRRASA